MIMEKVFFFFFWGGGVKEVYYGICASREFEKIALNMSIRRVIFTSGQNVKPPFLCQYLIFFNDFFFYFRDFIWINKINYQSEGIR